MSTKSIVIQFRLPQPYADLLEKEAVALTEQLDYLITPSAVVKSQLLKHMKSKHSKPKKGDMMEWIKDWGK